MSELFILGLFIWTVLTYRKETRLERQVKKFKTFQQQMQRNEKERQNQEYREHQRENMRELASIAIEHLEAFQRDIPPKLFDELLSAIEKYVDAIKFEKLYELYNLLRKSKKRTIYKNLQSFRR
ncbi:MAG: hypothetical protein GF353_14125 [Candidatus Lokiarchaeota archaeon]|nr:hypothetical protein [Candidatus Lokiarchaeota archaeon]